MKTSTKITLAILSLPFTSLALFYVWVQLFGQPPAHDYVDGLREAAWQMSRHCREEKLDPCDFHLESSSDPDSGSGYWVFTFYSKIHKKIRNITVCSGPDDTIMSGICE